MFQKIDLVFEVLFKVCFFFFILPLSPQDEICIQQNAAALHVHTPWGLSCFTSEATGDAECHHHLSAASDLRKGSVLVISPPAASSVFILFLPPNFCAHLIIQCILLNTFTF